MLPFPDTTAATRRRIARKYKLTEFPDPRPFLHIRCGDDIFDGLERAGVPGDRARWSDVVCEGPLHFHVEASAARRERAAYLSRRYLVPMTETYRELTGADRRVDRCDRYDEAVLWFEADLFDQAILVRLLARLKPLADRARISLICLGGFPGITRFIGLGQLSPDQLASLLPERKPVTRRQFALGTEAWAALHAPDPRALQRLARSRVRALPFLPAAMSRYLAEYPSTFNGLGRSAQLALEEIAAGALTPSDAFVRVQSREPRPFMGDSMLYAVIRDLAAGDHPAVSGAHPHLSRLPDAELSGCRIWLTDQGRKLLAGRLDWCRLSGVARPIGGVLLRGPSPRWRWDVEQERIIERRGR